MRKLHAVVCLVLGSLAPPTTATAQTAQQSVSVPVRHAETNSVRAVQFFASQKSKDGLMLAVYGGDANLEQTAIRAASELRGAGYPLRGIIFGPRRDDAAMAVEFYVDAQLAATYLNPSTEDAAAIATEVRRTYREILQPRTGAANLP